MELSLISHLKRHKDCVYTALYSLISFKFNWFKSYLQFRAHLLSLLQTCDFSIQSTTGCSWDRPCVQKLWSEQRHKGNIAGTFQSVHTRLNVPPESTRTWNLSWLPRNRRFVLLQRSLPQSAPSLLLLRGFDRCPLWNVSWGSPIFYFYFRFGSLRVSRRLYLPGCITNIFHALFSPSPLPSKQFSPPFSDPLSAVTPMAAMGIAKGPANHCRPFPSAGVGWFVSWALLVISNTAHNCKAWTWGKVSL